MTFDQLPHEVEQLKLDVKYLISLLENKQESSDILSIEQAADFLGLTKSTLQQPKYKKIPHFTKGRRVFYKKSDLENWITQGTQQGKSVKLNLTKKAS
jgi:predicted DNA-binding transcriptional regulator AlpA